VGNFVVVEAMGRLVFTDSVTDGAEVVIQMAATELKVVEDLAEKVADSITKDYYFIRRLADLQLS